MDLEVTTEALIIQLSRMINQIKDHPENLEKLDEQPVYLGSQMILNYSHEILRLDLRITKSELKL